MGLSGSCVRRDGTEHDWRNGGRTGRFSTLRVRICHVSPLDLNRTGVLAVIRNATSLSLGAREASRWCLPLPTVIDVTWPHPKQGHAPITYI